MNINAKHFLGTCLLLLINTAVYAQVEYVVDFTVTDEAALIRGADAWLTSRDAKDGQTTTLLSNMINGSADYTHIYVLDFPDYAALEKHFDRTAKSADFARYLTIENAVSSGASEGLYLHATDNGKSWKEGDYLYVVGVNVTGSSADYTAAVKDLINSSLGKKAPGLLRLVENRAGGDSSHTVLISAPSFTSLNKYLDSFTGDPAFEAFLSKVGNMSTVTGTSIYRVVKMWKG